MNKFKVIGSIIAFLILAGISCWATEKSLHMLLPGDWPEIIVWGITIAFFVVASIGTKLIADSLMSNEFVENRKGKLWGGILLVVFFWLIMSMPTNTHTFFYKDEIGSTILKDIETTTGYLQQIIEKGTSSIKTLDEEGTKIKNVVEAQRTHIVKQFHGQEPPYKKGNGEKIADHLKIINDTLHSSIKQHPDFNSANPIILNWYQVEIDRALDQALRTHTISRESVEAARKRRTNLLNLRDSINNNLAINSLTEPEIIQCQTELDKGYKIIASNKAFVQFDKNSDDEEVYTREITKTRTERLSSVTEVFFKDFLRGKYDYTFWYYVILSILVDIAAFIFFDIAFMKKND